MKKLGKNMNAAKETVEAYVPSGGGICGCYCRCSCGTAVSASYYVSNGTSNYYSSLYGKRK